MKSTEDINLLMENWRKFAENTAEKNNININELSVYIFHNKNFLKENKELDPIKKHINLKYFLSQYEKGKISHKKAQKIIEETLKHDEKIINSLNEQIETNEAVGDAIKNTGKAIATGTKKIAGATMSAIKQLIQKAFEYAIKAAMFLISSVVKVISVAAVMTGKAAKAMLNLAKGALKFFGVKNPSTKAAVTILLGIALIAICMILYKLGVAESYFHAQTIVDFIQGICPDVLGESKILNNSYRLTEAGQLDCASLPANLSPARIEEICIQQHGEQIISAAKGVLAEAVQKSGGEASSDLIQKQFSQHIAMAGKEIFHQEGQTVELKELTSKITREMLETIRHMSNLPDKQNVSKELGDLGPYYADALQAAASIKKENPESYNNLIELSKGVKVFQKTTFDVVSNCFQEQSSGTGKMYTQFIEKYAHYITKLYLKIGN